MYVGYVLDVIIELLLCIIDWLLVGMKKVYYGMLGFDVNEM